MTQARFTLTVQDPLTVDKAEDQNWDLETDVLVVGFGAAGAATALTAKDGGAAVLIADRFDNGGATARSGGVVYAGGGTPQQKAAGYDDTPEAMFNYLSREVGDAVKPETLQRFCADSRDQLAWLQSLGAGYESHPEPPKTSYPKNGVYLYYSGNEAITGFKEHAEPAPRGHRTVDKGLSGKRFFSVLRAAVEKAQIPVMKHCAVHRLIKDPQGRVIGAEIKQLPAGSAAAGKFSKLIQRAELVHNVAHGWADKLRSKAAAIEASDSVTIRVRARHGVCLCAGGFIMNQDMVREHAPKYQANMRLGTTGCDGSGIRLGMSAGGQLGRMHKVSAWRFINPPTPWIQGIAVNQQGERFCNEASYGARLGVEMCDNNNGKAWLILDKKQRRQAYKEALFGGLWIFQSIPALFLALFSPKGRTIVALAEKVGLPADALQNTVQRYNQAAATAEQDEQGKTAPALGPLEQGPYSALNISADNPNFPCPAITLGGLKVNEESSAVLNADGQDIPGLYAAGRTAIGIASNGYVSGLSLADCIWSGRRAGRALGKR